MVHKNQPNGNSTSGCSCEYCTEVRRDADLDEGDLLEARDFLLTAVDTRPVHLWTLVHSESIREHRPFAIIRALELLLNAGKLTAQKTPAGLLIARGSRGREVAPGGSPGGQWAQPVGGAAPPGPGFGAEPRRNSAARRVAPTPRAAARAASIINKTVARARTTNGQGLLGHFVHGVVETLLEEPPTEKDKDEEDEEDEDE